uniref:Integrator complex subunit 10 n=2 Tax=Hirondellea gigas TaxID=1518452 RepID=A0A6A7FWI1_9CRUS
MVVPDIELSNLADEEYLIYRAKELRLASSSASKSWLITAQVLYPNNFAVQFEVYLIEKAARNVMEAAKCLGNLLHQFQQEASLFSEIDNIMRAVQSNSSLFEDSDYSCLAASAAAASNDDMNFLTQLFYALPKGIQRGLVMGAAERCTDTMSHCSLLLLLTSLFPETTSLQAPNLVETLLSAEKMNPSPLNPYRRKLVCSVLPVLVSGESSSSLNVPRHLLHRLLGLAIEYYTALLYSSNSTHSANKSVHSSGNAIGNSSSVKPGNSDGSSNISSNSESSVWQSVFSCLRQLGGRLGWPLVEHLSNVEGNREMILQRVQAVMKNINTGAQPETEETKKELFYVTFVLFLHALYEYTTNVAKENSGGSMVGLTLVEAFIAPAGGGANSSSHSRSSSVCSDDLDVLSPPRLKKHRTSQDNDSLVPYISVGQGEGVCGAGLGQALSTCIKCWDLLHSHAALRTELTAQLERLSCIGSALRLFTTDMLLHDARLTEASRDIKGMMAQLHGGGDADAPPDAVANAQQAAAANTLPFSHLELCLKLASVNYALNNFSGAAEAALEAIKLLPPPSSTVPPSPTASAPPLLSSSHTAGTPTPAASLTISAGVERHLHLLPLSRAHCLQFVVTLLINALRTRIIHHKFHDDLIIGHLLTLVQFEWPKHEHIFVEMVGVLLKQGGLMYEQFPLYVITPEIIEELVYLHTRDGGALHLDIVPPTPHLSKQQRTVSTRGTDRGSKHDFKQAMKKQMLRSDESMPHNIITFLNTEGHSLHQNLM